MQQILTEWRKYLAEQAGPSPEAYKQILKKHMENYTLFRALAQEGRVAEIKKYISEDAKNVLHKIVYPSRHTRARIILPIKDRAYAAQLLSYYYADNNQIVKRYNKAYKQLLGLDAKLDEDVKEALVDVGLDIMGFVADPVFGAGAVFDTINMARHIQAGNILWATMSAISVIPGVGDVIAKGAKYILVAILKGAQTGIVKADNILQAMGYEESEGIRQFTTQVSATSVVALSKLVQDEVTDGLAAVLARAESEEIIPKKAAVDMQAQFVELKKVAEAVKTAKAAETTKKV